MTDASTEPPEPAAISPTPISPLRWAFVLLLAWAAGPGCATPTESTSQDYLADARTALEAGRLREARALTEIAREEHAAGREADALLAAILRHRARQAEEADKPDTAYTRYRKAAKLEPDPDRRFEDLSRALELGERTGVDAAQLTPLAEEAVQLRPNSKTVRRRAAHLFDEAGQADKAVDAYRWLWKREPDSTRIGNRVGALAKKLGRRDLAIDAYESVLEKDATNVQASINLAELYVQKGRPGEARALYERLLEAYPEKPGILMRYARFLARRGDTDRARKLRKRARENLPGVESRKMRDLQ